MHPSPFVSHPSSRRPDFTFKKAERLTSQKSIGSLFKGGHSLGMYPLRLVWKEIEAGATAFPVQVALSAPKKTFKTAVKRNLLRRRMREAWRLQKHRLYSKLSGTERRFAFMIIYVGKEELPSPDIHQAMQRLIHVFLKRLPPPLAKEQAD
jgi:ribonuclease P protein component